MNAKGCLNRKKRCAVLAVCFLVLGLKATQASAAGDNTDGNPAAVLVAQNRTPQAARQPASEAEMAERALERTLIRTGALLLPKGQFEVEPSLFYIRNEQQSASLIAGAVEKLNDDLVSLAVQLRVGLPLDTQLEFNVPYSRVSEESVTEINFQPVLGSRTTASHSGMDDVSLGVAKTLMVERDGRPNLIARLTWDSDSGDTRSNISGVGGSGFNEARISLAATRRQDPLVFLGGLSYQKSFEKNGVEPGDEIGLSVGAVLAASPDTSLRLVLDQTFVNDSKLQGQAVEGSETVVAVLTLGASSIIGAGRFLDFNIQAGLTDAAVDYAFGISLTMRFGAPRK